MKAISLLSMFFALSLTVQANTSYNYGNHGIGNYNFNSGRYGVSGNTQSELASIMALANSCGFPLNIDPNAFAAPPTDLAPQVLPPVNPGVGAAPPVFDAVDQPGIGNAGNGAPTVSNATGSNEGGTGTDGSTGSAGGSGSGDTGGDTGGESGGTKTSAADDQGGNDKAAFKSAVESIVSNTCLGCHGAGGGKSQRTAASLVAALESRGTSLANKMVGLGASLSASDLDAIRNFAGR
ncbi:MAG: hypothetical protein KDD51_07870 [Bdellovibrionales bacterium]|nr:hypothetical protein [Bdellovibrionales bacterium]